MPSSRTYQGIVFGVGISIGLILMGVYAVDRWFLGYSMCMITSLASICYSWRDHYKAFPSIDSYHRLFMIAMLSFSIPFSFGINFMVLPLFLIWGGIIFVVLLCAWVSWYVMERVKREDDSVDGIRWVVGITIALVFIAFLSLVILAPLQGHSLVAVPRFSNKQVMYRPEQDVASFSFYQHENCPKMVFSFVPPLPPGWKLDMSNGIVRVFATKNAVVNSTHYCLVECHPWLIFECSNPSIQISPNPNLPKTNSTTTPLVIPPVDIDSQPMSIYEVIIFFFLVIGFLIIVVAVMEIIRPPVPPVIPPPKNTKNSNLKPKPSKSDVDNSIELKARPFIQLE